MTSNLMYMRYLKPPGSYSKIMSYSTSMKASLVTDPIATVSLIISVQFYVATCNSILFEQMTTP